MTAKRIIPCLDVLNGKVVKGTNFQGLQYAGPAKELAGKYYGDGADELVLLDISATIERRKTMQETVKEIAKELLIPLTVGGGIKCIDDINGLLKCGADKVSINTAAIRDPKLVELAAKEFGSQCIVVSVDTKKTENGEMVFARSATSRTSLYTLDWAKKIEKYGAGEILLTSIDADGTRKGFGLEITRRVSEAAGIPVIASGGAGTMEDFYMALVEGKADAVLAASVFHYGIFTVGQLKEYLKGREVEVR